MPENHEPSENPTPEQAAQPVAYAPPHPYGAPAQQQQQSNGLSIASMALGLVALLTAGVGFYFATALGIAIAAVATVIAILCGLGALILGIIALIRRQRNKAAAITGLAASVLAGITVIALIAYMVIAALSPGWGGNDGPAEAHSDSSTEQVVPQSSGALQFDGEWPANFADGGLTFDETLMPLTSQALTAGDTPLAPAAERGDGPADILLFVDYRCPICMLFEQANGATLEEAITSGEATLQVRALTFLDRVSAGSEYSSRAASAMACIAEEQPKLAWPAHTALLSSDVQPEENNAGLTDDELIAAVEEHAGALTPATQSCIADHSYLPFAQAFTDWSFTNAIPNALDPTLAVQGTPFAIVNGVPYTGAPNDAVAFRAFLKDQGVALK